MARNTVFSGSYHTRNRAFLQLLPSFRWKKQRLYGILAKECPDSARHIQEVFLSSCQDRLD